MALLLHPLPSTAATTPTNVTLTLTLFLLLILLIALPYPAHSQVPTMTCISHLIPLSPCVPYVQGKATKPAQTCCINLKQVYAQNTQCLCLLINGTSNIGSMPINSTLALKLPAACDLQVDVSQCSAVGVPVPPPRAGSSQVSLGSNTNSTVAASPVMVPGAPRPASNMGSSLGLNAGAKLNMYGRSAVLAAGYVMFAIYWV